MEWKESMWERIIVQISSNAFVFRNNGLQISLLQNVHWLFHATLLMEPVLLKEL